MIFANALMNGVSQMVSGGTGFEDGGQGSLNRSPLSVRALGSEITRIDFATFGTGTVRLSLTGDQLTAVAGMTLSVGGNEYEIDAADFSSFASDETTFQWTGQVSNPFPSGNAFTVRLG